MVAAGGRAAGGGRRAAGGDDGYSPEDRQRYESLSGQAKFEPAIDASRPAVMVDCGVSQADACTNSQPADRTEVGA